MQVVEVNEYRIPALLDSGAEVNLIEEGMAKHIGIPFTSDGRLKLVDINDNETTLRGICENVDISIGPVTVTQSLLVVEKASQPMVLGMPYAGATAMSTNVFPGGRVEVEVTCPETGKRVMFQGAKRGPESEKQIPVPLVPRHVFREFKSLRGSSSGDVSPSSQPVNASRRAHEVEKGAGSGLEMNRGKGGTHGSGPVSSVLCRTASVRPSVDSAQTLDHIAYIYKPARPRNDLCFRLSRRYDREYDVGAWLHKHAVSAIYKRKADKVQPKDVADPSGDSPKRSMLWKANALARLPPVRQPGPDPFSGLITPRMKSWREVRG